MLVRRSAALGVWAPPPLLLLLLLGLAVRLGEALPRTRYSAAQDAAAAASADDGWSRRLMALERLCSEPSDEETWTNFCIKVATLLQGGYAPRTPYAWAYAVDDDDYSASAESDRPYKRFRPQHPKRASFLRFGRVAVGGGGGAIRLGYGDE